MEELKEMEKKSNAMDTFLEMIAESEDAPLDFKILNEERKISKLFKEIMTNKTYTKLPDESEEKKALYAFLQQEIQFLTDLKNKIN